jgi:single-strand DNA-binding protein
MNKVILIGRLTKDPELKTTASGIASTNFSVAVQRIRTEKEKLTLLIVLLGENKQKT